MLAVGHSLVRSIVQVVVLVHRIQISIRGRCSVIKFTRSSHGAALYDGASACRVYFNDMKTNETLL